MLNILQEFCEILKIMFNIYKANIVELKNGGGLSLFEKCFFKGNVTALRSI